MTGEGKKSINIINCPLELLSSAKDFRWILIREKLLRSQEHTGKLTKLLEKTEFFLQHVALLP